MEMLKSWLWSAEGVYRRRRERCHIHKGYDCCRRQTDMARRYPDDDPLRHVSSHSVALTVGLCMQRHHQHEIPARRNTSGVCNYWSFGWDQTESYHMWWQVFHLWSGFGLPFFLMLFAVVSLKWSRPTVTFVTCSGGKVTLGEAKLHNVTTFSYSFILFLFQQMCSD